MNYHQINWVLLLLLIQIIYNSSINVIIKQTSFFVNYSYDINLFLALKEAKAWAEKANINIKKLYKIYQELKTDIKFLAYRSVFYYNKYHAEIIMLKKRDKVYLLQKNIEITRSSNKLNYVKIRSFKIVRNIKEVSFKLKLFKDMQ